MRRAVIVLSSALALLLTAAAATQAASVPVTRCPTQFASGRAPQRVPPRLTLLGSSRAAANLIAYTNRDIDLIAPVGMRCRGIVAEDGGTQIMLWRGSGGPPGQHAHAAGLLLHVEPACSSCQAGVACPFFPAFARSLDFPCSSGVPAGEQVVRHGPGLALFRDPAGVAGTGWQSGGPYAANGVTGIHGHGDDAFTATCTLPAAQRAACTTSLNDTIARYG